MMNRIPFSLALLLLCASANADLVTISGTGQFDTSLGTLTRVTVRFDPGSTSTNPGTPHAHFFDPTPFQVAAPIGSVLDFRPIFTSFEGTNIHVVDPPSFLWNGRPVNPPSTTTTPEGSHQHSVDFPAVTVQANNFVDLPRWESSFITNQSHSFNIPTFNVSFADAGTLNFFSNNVPTSSYTIPAGTTTSSGSHSHRLADQSSYQATINGVLQPVTLFNQNSLFNTFSTTASPHQHTYGPINGNVVSTTFEFTAVPEPSSFVFLSVVLMIVTGIQRFNRRVTMA